MPLAASKGVRLRVGVIGLGRLWEARHKPALARLADRFRVTAVYDQVARRAAIEATQVGCAAAEGFSVGAAGFCCAIDVAASAKSAAAVAAAMRLVPVRGVNDRPSPISSLN